MRKLCAVLAVLAAMVCLTGASGQPGGSAPRSTPPAAATAAASAAAACQPDPGFGLFLGKSPIEGVRAPAPIALDTCVFLYNDCNHCARGLVQDCDFYQCTRPDGSQYTQLRNCTTCSHFC
jgi:hypothetical protein